MRKKLVILGNSGAARECYWLALDCIAAGMHAEVRGFLSFEGHGGDLRDLAHMALGLDDAYRPEPGDSFVIGIGDPALRQRAFCKWKNRGAAFVNLIHPQARLVGNPTLGEGNILACNSYVSCDSTLGDANYLNGSVVIGHDVRMGSFNFWGPFSMALGGARIGSRNTFGVFSVALAHAKVGDGNTIAPGACLYKGCGNGTVMGGNPAFCMGNVTGMENVCKDKPVCEE